MLWNGLKYIKKCTLSECFFSHFIHYSVIIHLFIIRILTTNVLNTIIYTLMKAINKLLLKSTEKKEIKPPLNSHKKHFNIPMYINICYILK